jgi:hypothetical protein
MPVVFSKSSFGQVWMAKLQLSIFLVSQHSYSECAQLSHQIPNFYFFLFFLVVADSVIDTSLFFIYA